MTRIPKDDEHTDKPSSHIDNDDTKTLSRLYDLSDKLLETSQSTSSQTDSDFSLMQMAMIHETLFDSADAFGSDRCGLTEGDEQMIRAEIRASLDKDKPHRAILSVQYLLRHWDEGDAPDDDRFSNHPIISVALPLLLRQTERSDRDNDFQNALLEIVFSRTDYSEAVILKIAKECCDHLPSSPETDTGKLVELQCRLLLRLMRYDISNVLSIAVKFLIRVLSDGHLDPGGVRAVTSLLLPELYKSPKETLSTELLEEFLFERLFRVNSSVEELNIGFGIVCVLYSRSCPVIAVWISNPTYRDIIWSRIRYALNQSTKSEWGFKAGVRGGGGRVEERLDDARLLRRRALYILREIISSGVEGKVKKIWKVYVNCADALEMEHEQHLIDQIWGGVRQFCEAVRASDAPNYVHPKHALPAPDREFLTAIFCRIFYADAPTLRKLGLYRFLNRVIGVPSLPTLLPIILRSYDSLGSTVGHVIQIQEKGKLVVENLTPKLREFIQDYLLTEDAGDTKENTKLETLLHYDDCLSLLKPSTVVLVLEAVRLASLDEKKMHVSRLCFENVVSSLDRMGIDLTGRGILPNWRWSILNDLASLLHYGQTSEIMLNEDGVLKLLGLYYPSHLPLDRRSVSFKRSFESLGYFLQKHSEWVKEVIPECCLSFISSDGFSQSSVERTRGSSIVYLCHLGLGQEIAAALLWPVIQKIFVEQETDHAEVKRAWILLDYSCQNGIFDSSNMNGLAEVETVLERACLHLERELDLILRETCTAEKPVFTSSRSGRANLVFDQFSLLLEQFSTLYNAFSVHPSDSNSSISTLADKLLNPSLTCLSAVPPLLSDSVARLSMIHAATHCGARPASMTPVQACTVLVNLSHSSFSPTDLSSSSQTLRSLFHYVKWGALSRILPLVKEENSIDTAITALYQQVVLLSQESVSSVPVDVLPLLFESVRVASLGLLERQNEAASSATTSVVIRSLMKCANESDHNHTKMVLLRKLSFLIFRPKFLREEYGALLDDTAADTPIRDAFRYFVREGEKRPYLLHFAVSRMVVAWEGCDITTAGINAIPYREDLVKLIVWKEQRVDPPSLTQGMTAEDEEEERKRPDHYTLPDSIHDLSVTRWFVLTFLCNLPTASPQLPKQVQTELMHYIILQLLETYCVKPTNAGSMLMSGMPEYTDKIRAWQALCLLYQHVSAEIAPRVAAAISKAMELNLHGPIRYFLEVFCIQCSLRHPQIFANKLVVEMTRTDLTLQHVSSLMIIVGNLVCRSDLRSTFFGGVKEEKRMMELFLHGTLPWLSSTQGFSRAIAQLLVFRLIPEVLSESYAVNKDLTDNAPLDNRSYLHSMINFLSTNKEMKRLRKKQSKFFDNYDFTKATTLEGILSFNVDTGDEAHPPHMAELIKKCLDEVYSEMHPEDDDVPSWKQIEATQDNTAPVLESSDEEDTIQRKIAPLDALHLVLSDHVTRRTTLNGAGNRKRPLVICASLIDKIPNLAGLARTAEIFAATKLVVPDLQVRRMDLFKGISVGAEMWVEMEECKEENLLRWLIEMKEEGYTIIGLEQTSSSTCITQMNFPEKTVLLLGKEKEGIPLQFLQVVDTCVEIPQFGIIRSLNVHVSGALAIWEYSKQIMPKY